MKFNHPVSLIVLLTFICFFVLATNPVSGQKSIEFIDNGDYISEAEEKLISDAYYDEIDSEWNTKLHIIVSSRIDLYYYEKRSNVKNNILLQNEYNLSEFDPLSCFLIIINPEQKQSKIVFRDRNVKLSKTITENINKIYLDENLNNSEYSIPYVQAIPPVVKDIIRAIKDKRGLKNIQPVEVATDSFSLRFWSLIIVIGMIVIGYLILAYVKYNKPGHRYETQQFYAFDRFSNIARKTLSFVIVILLLFFSCHYVYFFDEIAYVALFLLFAYIPLTNFVLYTVFLVKDFVTVKRNFAKPDVAGLGLIPSLLLLKPSVTSFELLEYTLNSLLLREQLIVRVEWKHYRDGRSRPYVRIEKGAAFDLQNAKNYELPLLKPFEDLDMLYGYYLHDYLGLIDSDLIGSKYFKKDLVSMHLIERGMLSRKARLVNVFKPNASGVKAIEKLKGVRSEIKKRLRETRGDKNAIEQIINQTQDRSLLIEDLCVFLASVLGKDRINELLCLDNSRINFC